MQKDSPDGDSKAFWQVRRLAGKRLAQEEKSQQARRNEKENYNSKKEDKKEKDQRKDERNVIL